MGRISLERVASDIFLSREEQGNTKSLSLCYALSFQTVLYLPFSSYLG